MPHAFVLIHSIVEMNGVSCAVVVLPFITIRGSNLPGARRNFHHSRIEKLMKKWKQFTSSNASEDAQGWLSQDFRNNRFDPDLMTFITKAKILKKQLNPRAKCWKSFTDGGC